MKRLIPKLPSPPVMNNELVNEITDLCFYESASPEGNILITFGSNVGICDAARRTLGELKKGRAKLLVLTGGVTSGFQQISELKPGQSEAQVIYEAICADPAGEGLIHGVEYLIVEKASQNIKENVANLHRRLKFFDDDHIVCVCHAYAARRVVLTMKRYFPDVEVRVLPFSLNVAVTNDLTVNLSRQSWFKGSVSRALVWGEVLRIEAYGAKGDMWTEKVSRRIAGIRTLVAQTGHLVCR